MNHCEQSLSHPLRDLALCLAGYLGPVCLMAWASILSPTP